nr:hypothetical protein [Azospirillum rugosum]
MQQAKKAWERDMEAMDAKDAKQRLTDKADAVRQPFALTPKQQQERTSALSALEEAKRVGGPKAAAEQKLEEVERKIAELKLMMRYSHGNREKLAQLAREAAILAREAGRAAKQYGEGVAAAAEMGLPGGAGAPGTEIVHTVTRTSLTVVQTEMSVDVTVTLSPDALARAQGAMAQGGDAAGAAALARDVASSSANQDSSGDGPPAGETDALAAEASDLEDQAAQASLGEEDGAAPNEAPTDGMPPDVAEAVKAALGGIQPGSGALSSDGRRALMQRMIADNDLKMSRYREADAFGQRVEKILATVKSIIGEAKVVNEADLSEERRKARRESFKAYDKIVDGAQDEVNGLRQAAFGSGISPREVLDILTGGDDGNATTEGGAEAGANGAVSPADAASAGGASAVNLLA